MSTEEKGFALEMAISYGFESDDDLENWTCTTEQLYDFMKALHFNYKRDKEESIEPIKVAEFKRPAELPPLYGLWSHVGSGNIYKVIGYSNLHSKNRHKFPIMVRYENEHGQEWSRPVEDWHRVFTPATTETWQ